MKMIHTINSISKCIIYGIFLTKHVNSLSQLNRRSIIKTSLITSSALNLNPSFAEDEEPWSVSDLYTGIDKDRIVSAAFSPDGRLINVLDVNEQRHIVTIFPMEIEKLENKLMKHSIPFSITETSNTLGFAQLFLSNMFQLAFVAFIFNMVFSRVSAGSGVNIFKQPSKIMIEPKTNVTFYDVAGCDESKLELEEVVDFLKNPFKYDKFGAQSPRGVLLEGPPGTGKTLLARAIAGEAGVPFIATSGSEFVEVFVGVGASRIRNLFKEAKENAPCILFIDEIDAIGKKRSDSNKFGGSNDEREQTLNQILTEMDGFDGNSGVIVLAATNRGETLDNALLRPGRFDRRIPISLPTKSGRFDILNIHSRNKILSTNINLDEIASRTIGFSGASLKNLLNEAAIVTARRNGNETTYDDIDSALDRITVGIKKSITSNEEQKRLIAYHEAGHALMAALTPNYDNVTKVTIIPRSNGAGGLTLFTPSEERVDSGLYTFKYLRSQLAVALGGRVAEEIIYGTEEVTTGASSDLQKVRGLARRMISQWGFRDNFNSSNIHDVPVAWESSEGTNPYKSDNSVETEVYLDIEVKKIVQSAYKECYNTLNSHKKVLDDIVTKLVEKESLSGNEIQDIICKSTIVL